MHSKNTGKTTDDPLFWKKVDKKESGCWEWIGCISNGYGQLMRKGNHYRAHRYVLMLSGIEVPAHLVVLHACDNPKCVNPDHLSIGTQLDNWNDCVRKDRHARGQRNGMHTKPHSRSIGDKNGAHTHPERLARGEKSPSSKITGSDVLKIREQRTLGATYNSLSVEFGISIGAVVKIVKGRSWKHVK